MSPLRNVLLSDDVVVSGWGEAPSWGEDAMVPSPALGRWYAVARLGVVKAGDVLGEVHLGDDVALVLSPYRARLIDVLIIDGHPVEPGRPLVWIERADTAGP